MKRRIRAFSKFLVTHSVFSVLCLVDSALANNVQEIHDPSNFSKGHLLVSPAAIVTGSGLGDYQRLPLYQTNFDSVSTDWKLTGQWQIGQLPASDPQGQSGKRVAATHLTEPYANWSDGSLASPLIQLPELQPGEQLELRFKELYELESYQDYGLIEASTDGGVNWTKVISTRTGTTQQQWVESRYSLSAFAGRALTFRFRLRTDAEHRFSGWYIDDLAIDKLSNRTLALNIRSIDAQRLPQISLDVELSPVAGLCPKTFSPSNFQVLENNQNRNNITLTHSSQRLLDNAVDLVFLYDNSGSMRDEQQIIENKIAQFIQELKQTNLDFTLGLLRYGEPDNGRQVRVENAGTLVADSDHFLNKLLPDSLANNSFEASYQALITATSAFNFRPNAQPVFIVITDEFSGQGLTTVADAKKVLDQFNATLFAVTYADLFADFEPLIKNPATQLIAMAAPLTPILQQLKADLINTLKLNYNSDVSLQDTKTRQVTVTVNCANVEATAQSQYTPNASPRITLSENAQHATGAQHQAGKPIEIAIDIADLVSPFVSGAKLFYRSGGGEFQKMTMQQRSVTRFVAEIPAEAVTAPAVEYYIATSDGLSPTTRPRHQPWNRPLSLPVR